MVDAVLERKPCRYAYTGGLAISALSSPASADLTVADGLRASANSAVLAENAAPCGVERAVCVWLCDGMRES